MMSQTRGSGSFPPRYFKQMAQARQPMRICPLPPRFQNFILKATTSATATPSSRKVFWNKSQVRRSVPKAPEKSALKKPKKPCDLGAAAEMTISLRMRATRTAAARMRSPFQRGIPSRRVMWMNGSLVFFMPDPPRSSYLWQRPSACPSLLRGQVRPPS